MADRACGRHRLVLVMLAVTCFAGAAVLRAFARDESAPGEPLGVLAAPVADSDAITPLIARIHAAQEANVHFDGPRPVASERLTAVFDAAVDPQYPVYRTPAMVSAGGATLVFAEGRQSLDHNAPADLVLKRSTDRGDTWGPMSIVVGVSTGLPGVAARDCSTTTFGHPVPVALPGGMDVLLAFTVNSTDVFVTRSADGGATWAKPENVTAEVKQPGWGLMATGPGHGLVLANGPHAGRVVVPLYHALSVAEVTQVTRWEPSDPRDPRSDPVTVTSYTINNPYADREHGASHRALVRDRSQGVVEDAVHLSAPATVAGLNAFEARDGHAAAMYSDDGGKTWLMSVDVPDLASSEVQMAQLENGEVVASFRVEHNRTRGCRHFAFSTDGGALWQQLHQLGATPAQGFNCTVLDPGCHGSLIANRNTLYACGPQSRWQRQHLALYRSRDGGRTWDVVGRPFTEIPEAGYSDMVVWPPLGVHPWDELGAVFEQGAGRRRISMWRVSLGNRG